MHDFERRPGLGPIRSRFNQFGLPAILRPPFLAGPLSWPNRPGAPPIRLLPGLVPLPRHLPDQGGLSPSLGRIGSLEVRLATTKKDIKRAQRLRYKVFYEEMSAVPNAAALLARRDMDDFDPICDHLLVIDHGPERPRFSMKPFDPKSFSPKSFSPKAFSPKSFLPKPKVVGTYRLLRQEVADRNFGFYTSSEFDIQPVLDRHPDKRFLELGRSCVLKPYRNKRTVELLWHGIWTYVLHHRIDAMIGCASLEGTNPNDVALPLSFLSHFAKAPEEWRTSPVAGRNVSMDRMPKEAVNVKAAMQSLPPLIKGYLRLGATVGDGAVIDRQFGTVDVLIVMPVTGISQRYIDHFGPTANRHAA